MGIEGRLALAGSWVWRDGASDAEGSSLKMSTDVVARVARHAAAMENTLHCRAKKSLKSMCVCVHVCARVCVVTYVCVRVRVCIMTYVCLCLCV